MSRSLGISLSLLLGLVACSSGPATESNDNGESPESGALMLSTPNVPSDVKCIVLTLVGPGATVTRAFDVTPSQPASMAATGLPIGAVTLTEGAYNAACAQVTSQTPLTWVSAAPVVVQLAAGQSTAVSIDLRRAGGLVVNTSFTDNVDAGASNTAPTIATAAAVMPSPVLGTAATLSVLGADDGGESNLTYTWATTGTPPAAVSFASNGTNAAKSTTAVFSAAGTYAFQVTVRDQAGLTALSAASVTVTAKLTSIVITPTTASVSVSATQQFTAVARNQFSAAISPQPTFTWAVSGGGSISTSGLFTAGATGGGPYTVTASSGGVSATAGVTVVAGPTRVVTYQINAGSTTAVSPFSADTYMTGGTAHSVTNTITTTGVTSPAPTAVYQSERYGNTTYTIPNLVASGQYVVRLHFAELYWTATGKRVFNVTINGTAVLSNFDIYSAAGGQYKAHVREFTTTANASGQIVIAFTTVTDNAAINGIEVLALKYANGASCSQASQCQSGKCTNGVCVSGCATQSSLNLIPAAGFDTSSALANWTSATGTTWNGSDDADACTSSGSVSFTSAGTMNYCFKSATTATYYLGMRGKGTVGCIGAFYSDKNCTTALGPDFLNLAPTSSTAWASTSTMGVTAPSGTQSIMITCMGNGGTGAIDQIYLNQGTSTGFGGTATACTQQSNKDLIPGAGFDTSAALANWNTGAGGASWTSDDAESCSTSGSVSLTSTGSMNYCFKSATAATYYLGMKGKGNAGCLGTFYSDKNCTSAVGYEFLNLAPTGSSTWQDTSTGGVTAPTGTQSILVTCTTSGNGTGAVDQVYLNQGASTGFSGGSSCTSQSSLDLITAAGFDTSASLANWTSQGGTSWSSSDAESCTTSGSVSFTSSGSMSYCYKSATAATYFLGMKGKGSVGCIGAFHSDKNCTTALGPDFLNLAPSDSSAWQDTYTMGIAAPSGTQSILITCSANGFATGAIDQIYLNQGSSTGFSGAAACTQQSSLDLITGAGFDTSSALGNWNTSSGGTSWTSSDAQGCGTSGSVTFTASGQMTYCAQNVTGTTFYLGMKGRGSVGCIGMFNAGTTCAGTTLGPDFLNLGSTGSSAWADAFTGAIPAPSGTHSVLIQCAADGSTGGAIDQIYLNQGASTGFGGVTACTQQSSLDLITGAGFDTSSALGNWNTSSGGTSWTSSDAQGCGTSGSVTFTASGQMTYCAQNVTGTTFYLGMKGKGSVGCIGMFNAGTTCAGTALGPDFLNLAPTDSTSWQDTYTGGIPAPSGTHSILIQCAANGSTSGAIDQIYLNQGTATGFGG